MKNIHKTQINKFAILPVLFLLIVFMGCEPEIVTKIDIPEQDPMLAVSCFLMANEAEHVVFIGKSKPHNKPTTSEWSVGNAVVEISDGTKSVILDNLGDGYYSFKDKDLEVKPNGNYSLKAYAPNFADAAKGSCKIPAPFNPGFEFIKFDSVTENEFTMHDIEFRFKDEPGEGDFYRVQATFKSINPSIISDTILYKLEHTLAKNKLISDKDNDGKWMLFKMSAEVYYMGFKMTPVAVQIDIYRTDEAYYRYHYPFVVQDYWPSDNPFAEPVIIYDNITGGYGIMSGLVKFTKEVSL